MLLLFVKLTERWAKHYLAADTAEAEIIVEFSNTIAFVARDREKESAFWFLHESRLSATVVPTGSICYSRRRFTQVSQTRAGTGVHALPRACRILSGSAARSVPSPAHSASTYIRRHFFICLLTRKTSTNFSHSIRSRSVDPQCQSAKPSNVDLLRNT